MKTLLVIILIVSAVSLFAENTVLSMPERNKKEILITGHRGNAKFSPENTLTSYRKAIELGADIIETDVRLTKDGVPVFCHDGNIDRTSNGTGNICDKTLAELKGYDFGYRAVFRDKFKGEPILTLEDGLKFFKEKNVKFLLEIKENQVIEPISKLVKKINTKKKNTKFLVWSIGDSKDICKYLKGYDIYHLAPLDAYLAAENKDGYFRELKDAGITGFSVNYHQLFGMDKKDTDLFLILAAKYKMPVGVWTIDSTGEINNAMNYMVKGTVGKKSYLGKIDIITTNDPLKAILLRDN